jgi:glycosyltransferase involved in cell wall biosynthesis
MYKDHRIITVVPAHNEESHIGHVIKSMPEFVDHILVIDDCSEDKTSASAEATCDERLVLMRPEKNQGLGGAMLLGYRRALEMRGDVIVKMDGDGQMSPDHLPALLDAIVESGYDYAKGNRFLAGSSLSEMPRHRLLGNVVLTFLTKLASGYWHVFDPQNGYTAIRRDALSVLRLDAIHRGFFFENDMLVHLNFFGFRVKDVPIPARYGDEQSDLKVLNVGVTFPALLVRRYFYRIYQKYVLRDFSPIALFLFLGMILFFWGAFFGIYLWIKSYLTGQATLTGTIMLALLPLILGFQLLLQAIVLDIQETPK